jgi:Ser-tRNA(Ala) deacylase AlaX
MPTHLLCLENTYNYNCQAVVLEIGLFEDKYYIILDQTVFYPQGGGQPSDIGTISNGSKVFNVTKCQIIEDKCYQFGSFADEKLEVGESVEVRIDSIKRNKHARLHTAGHLIDLALPELGINLEPTKGFHFESGPYVEYADPIPVSQNLILDLEKTLQKIIDTDAKVSFTIEEGNHANGKPMRTMHIEGYPECPCGGTHVEHLAQIGTIKIRKIKGNRVAYEII